MIPPPFYESLFSAGPRWLVIQESLNHEGFASVGPIGSLMQGTKGPINISPTFLEGPLESTFEIEFLFQEHLKRVWHPSWHCIKILYCIKDTTISYFVFITHSIR